jgi:hypothetical protein
MSRWPHSAQKGPVSGVPQLRHAAERAVAVSVRVSGGMVVFAAGEAPMARHV